MTPQCKVHFPSRSQPTTNLHTDPSPSPGSNLTVTFPSTYHSIQILRIIHKIKYLKTTTNANPRIEITIFVRISGKVSEKISSGSATEGASTSPSRTIGRNLDRLGLPKLIGLKKIAAAGIRLRIGVEHFNLLVSWWGNMDFSRGRRWRIGLHRIIIAMNELQSFRQNEAYEMGPLPL